MSDEIDYCHGCGAQITMEFGATSECTCPKPEKEYKSFEDCMGELTDYEDY